MKFSIIIPVYNVEDYLEECMESILNQTYQDFELLLIDDGSTDQSGHICDSYAQRYPEHIRVLHQQNCGVKKSRVTGLKTVTGEICVFVDSDDCLRGDALEKINEAFETTACDLVLYGASRDAEFAKEAYMLPLESGRCFEGEAKKELYALMIESGKLSSMCMKAAKKSLYDSFLADYDEDLKIDYGEDQYLSMPLMTHAKKITYLREKLYYYRPREGSMVNSFCPSLHRQMKIVRMEMERYIQRWGIQDCYPLFYTRVVRNWLHALKCLLKNQSILPKEEVLSILRELSEDDFFRKAYDHRIPEQLPRQDRLLANWLYRGKYTLLRGLGYGLRLVKGNPASKAQR